MKYDPRKVLAVRCPRCGAKPGGKCKSANGKFTNIHTLRKGVVYRSYLKSPRGGRKQGLKTPAIKITAIYLQTPTPQQGEAIVDGVRIIWEREGAEYKGYELSDADWERIERPPVSVEDHAELQAIWVLMKSKTPYVEFFHEDAEWSSDG